MCMLTGKKGNVANSVSHSNRRTKRKQHPNLQWKRVYDSRNNRYVLMRLSTKAIKTLAKNGLNLTSAIAKARIKGQNISI